MSMRSAMNNKYIQANANMVEGFLDPCYRLYVCVLPKFICSNPNPQWDDTRRWVLWEMIRARMGVGPSWHLCVCTYQGRPYESTTRKTALTKNPTRLAP